MAEVSGKDPGASLDAGVLGSFEMLSGVGLTARKDLLAGSEVLHMDAGQVIIRQGAANATMFMLVEGELAVHLDAVENEPLAIMGAGEIVGELSLLDGSVASA